jgi:hypothetical protein
VDVYFDVHLAGRTIDDIKYEALEIVNDFFNEVNAGWSDGGVIIYSSDIHSRLMEIEGVKNISGLTINDYLHFTLSDNHLIKCKNVYISEEDWLGV